MLDFFTANPAAAELFRFMELKAGSGVFAYDLSTRKLEWSQGMYALLALAEGPFEPTLELFRTFVHPRDRMTSDELHARSALGLPFEREIRSILHDGRTRWLLVQYEFLFDESGIPIRLLGLCTDVTDRRVRDASLLAARTRFENMVKGVAPLVFVADSNGLTTQAFGWGDLTGRSDSTALGMDWVDGLHVDDRDRTVAAWRTACESGNLYEHEARVLTPAGSRLVRATAAPALNASGRVTEWYGIVVDCIRQPNHEAVTGAQIRSARAMMKWSVADLSEASGVSVSIIRRLEDFEGSPPRSEAALSAIHLAVSAAGVEFVFAPGAAPGVRPTGQRAWQQTTNTAPRREEEVRGRHDKS